MIDLYYWPTLSFDGPVVQIMPVDVLYHIVTSNCFRLLFPVVVNCENLFDDVTGAGRKNVSIRGLRV